MRKSETKASPRLNPCFRRDETGTATVEFVLWFPLFVLVIALVTDVSFLFNRQALMLRSVQDANRAYSVGLFTTPTEVETLLLQQYQPVSANATVESVLLTGREAGDAIRTTLSVPARDVVTFGLIANVTGLSLTVSSEHYREF